MYPIWEVAGDEAEIWDAAAAHVNIVVAFLQMSASRFINGVWFGKNLRREGMKDGRQDGTRQQWK